MRTKTLLLTAALAAAGLATSMAQTVYSVNIVGYVNLTIPKGFSIIANPLVAATNTVSQLFGAATPEETTIYKFNNATGQYSVNSFEFSEWSNPTQTLVPGEGAFIRVSATQAPNGFTNTFVGEVRTGDLTNSIPRGFSIISSQVPQAGLLTTDLKYTPDDNDTVYLFNNATGQYSVRAFEFGEWSSQPSIAVGQGFFIKKDAAGSWKRNFPVG